jgi:hypothetical protein
MVVLHEDVPDAGGGEVGSAVRLHKEAALVPVHDRFDPLHTGQVGRMKSEVFAH